MENKTDKRVIKTKQKLTCGLVEILKTTNIKDVKVNKLTSASNVNRATFYLHYTDIDDFLAKIENELADEFTEIFDKYPICMHREGKSLTVCAIFEFIVAHTDLLKAIFGPNGDNRFAYRLSYIARSKIPKQLNICSCENTNDYYSIYYMINGCIGVIFKWIDGGMKESPEEMALIIQNLISNGIKATLINSI